MTATRIGANLHRVDLRAGALGFPAAPASGDVRFVRSGRSWTFVVSCASGHADAFSGWLFAAGATEIQQGPASEPAILRGTAARLPLPCQEAAALCRIEHVSLTPDGGASMVVRGDDESVARLVHRLGHPGAAPVEMPPLTARQAELLEFCVSRGYYSIPRRASLRALGAELGISATSLSLALRRAEAKIILAHAARLRQLHPPGDVARETGEAEAASPDAVRSGTGGPRPKSGAPGAP